MKDLKSFFYSLPTGIQRSLGFHLRSLQFPLKKYKQRRASRIFDTLDIRGKKDWIFHRVKKIAVYAQDHNKFYSDYYRDQGFDAKLLKSYEDLNQIPIVTKEILRDAGDNWMPKNSSYYSGNTGGTSGNPLCFLYDREQLIKESLFIKAIWNRLDCSDKNSRLVFRGLSHFGEKSWVYHPEGDAFLINTYLPLEKMKSDLVRLFIEEKIEFLHGYPSAIYQFAKICLLPQHDDLRSVVQRNLKGVLYGSEYPSPVYRNAVEMAFHVPSISWYGHSEMTVLASERDVPFLYYPFQGYGWCEAVDMPDGRTHLVGTNYLNKLSPFIRYDTGDGVEPVDINDDYLTSFRITEARLGEFVLDVNKSPVSLTSLIFGRHHKIFDTANFVQISQDMPGHATFYVTAPDIDLSKIDELFDLKNVDINFDIELMDKPFRTKLGKTPLLVPADALKH